MLRRTLIASAAVLGVTLACAAAQAQIRIATVGPMTGSYAAVGAQMKAGAEQAVADRRLLRLGHGAAPIGARAPAVSQPSAPEIVAGRWSRCGDY